MIPSSLIKRELKKYLGQVTRQELRNLLYEVVPNVPPDIVDVFAEVAAWDQQKRPRNKAAQLLNTLRRKG